VGHRPVDGGHHEVARPYGPAGRPAKYFFSNGEVVRHLNLSFNTANIL
jgi:hypothetical protein